MTYGMGGQFRANETPDVSRNRGEKLGEIQILEARLERLSLVCRAMWSLLVEKTKFTEAHLIERMNKLDLADGQADGKLKKTAENCPDCGRPISPRHARCMFCGTGKAVDSAFDLV